MDPDFQARYLNERESEDGSAPFNPERTAGVRLEPHLPAAPSMPEPVAPPAEATPDWAETTQVVEPFTRPPAAPPARPAAEGRPEAPPVRPPDGAADYRDAGPRHREAPQPAEPRQQVGPPPRPMAAPFDPAAHRAPPPPPSFGPPRGPGPGYEAARHEAPIWDASGSTFAGPNAPALRAEDVVAARKLPPEMGWRRGVYVGSGRTINLGAGPAEQRLREQIDLIKTNIPGNYLIGVMCVRGGVGKTRMTAGVGTAYATYRTEPVIAIDANPTYGALGRVIDPTATASIREFLADANLRTYPMARHYTGKNKPGLEVLAANQNVASPFDLTPQAFTAVLDRVRRFYQLALVDCGPEIEHPVMQAVLSSVDALIIVGTMNYDGAAAAETTIKWLAARSEYQALLRRSALVLNDVYNCADKDFLAKVTETIGQRVGGVTTVPWDRHLRDNPELDFDALSRDTRYAYLDVAAGLAAGFRSGRMAHR